MKIAALCNDRLGLAILDFLSREKMLAGIATTDRNPELLEKLGVIALNNFVPIRIISKEKTAGDLNAWLDECKADCIWLLTFPYKIPKVILDRMEYGAFNFHFARLPQYRGPTPLFWEIRNQETIGGISVYLMDEGWDTGPLAVFEEVPIHPEDNYGLHQTRLAFAGVPAAQKLLTFLEDPDWRSKLQPQDESQAAYPPRPEFKDLIIDWENMDQSEIMALIKAANPWNRGAYTVVNEIPLRILEVTPANATEPVQAPPGVIVVSDAQQGMFVACKEGKLLRIDVVYLQEGYMTGYQLYRLGIQPGMAFVPIVIPEGVPGN